MNELKGRTVELGKSALFRKGFAFKSTDYKPHGIPIVKVSDFSQDSIDPSSCVCISKEEAPTYQNFSLSSGDILISTVGSWPSNPASVVGKVVQVPISLEGSLLNQNIVRLRADPNVFNHTFLYYALRSIEFKNYVISGAQGSANQASITLELIKSYQVPHHCLYIQEAIADILRSFDAKICNNRQINSTLEAISETIFRTWFLDHNQTIDWEKGCIGDIGLDRREKRNPTELKLDTPYIGLEHMPQRCTVLSDWGTTEEVSSIKSVIVKGDILFGKLRPYFHKVGLSLVDGVCSTDILVVKPRYSEYRMLLLGYLSSNEVIAHAAKVSNGTRMPRTSWTDLASYQITVPPSDVVSRYDKLVSNLYTKICSNVECSRKLIHYRDTLLPKLISGELRIKEAEKLAGDVL